MQQAAIADCLSFDPFAFNQNGLATSEIDVGGRQVGDALVISQVIVVGDDGRDLAFEIARQVIVLEQDAVLERLMPALDLSLGHRMIRRATVCSMFWLLSHLARSPIYLDPPQTMQDVRDNRCNVDTGAGMNGPLSAAIFNDRQTKPIHTQRIDTLDSAPHRHASDPRFPETLVATRSIPTTNCKFPATLFECSLVNFNIGVFPFIRTAIIHYWIVPVFCGRRGGDDKYLSRVAVFLFKDGGLTKAHVHYRERQIIQAIKQAGRATLTNKANCAPSRTLSEAERADMARVQDEIMTLGPIHMY